MRDHAHENLTDSILLEQISCRSFRNLQDLPWQPGPGCHLVLGPNGAGKSSLLEAIYILATTRSFRTAQILDCARHGSTGFHVEGETVGDQRIHIEVGLGSEGRYRSSNGSVTSLVDHLRTLPVVAWTGEDRETLDGPPEKRRRFLDQGIVGIRPAALETLARFRRAIFQKRQLLQGDHRGLRSWNEVMAAAAAELMRMRREYVESVGVALREILAATDMDLPDLRLEYRPSIRVESDDEDEILQELERVRSQERRERRPIMGPQRDEVVVRWGDHNVRRVGSAGEKKILGLLLTAARGRVLAAVDRTPIYLLDDADSELDEGRLGAAWEAFQDSSQVFVSSSRPAIWSMVPEAVRWQLTAGRIGLEEG